ncbi:NAD(P)H:quinone oxidoreductase, partial [Streptococcus suis]
VADGAREAGATVDIKRVPELVPADVAKASHYKFDQAAPVAKVEELAEYDAIVVGTGTRFGRMASQMANFLDQAGGLWAKGALHGKVGGALGESGRCEREACGEHRGGKFELHQRSPFVASSRESFDQS